MKSLKIYIKGKNIARYDIKQGGAGLGYFGLIYKVDSGR